MGRVDGENAHPFASRTAFADWPYGMEPWHETVRQRVWRAQRPFDAFAWYGRPDRTPGKM